MVSPSAVVIAIAMHYKRAQPKSQTINAYNRYYMGNNKVFKKSNIDELAHKCYNILS